VPAPPLVEGPPLLPLTNWLRMMQRCKAENFVTVGAEIRRRAAVRRRRTRAPLYSLGSEATVSSVAADQLPQPTTSTFPTDSFAARGSVSGAALADLFGRAIQLMASAPMRIDGDGKYAEEQPLRIRFLSSTMVARPDVELAASRFLRASCA